MKTQNRNNTIDITKGIGILLVIIGHTAGNVLGIGHVIYSFHMPLFFILAGYFYKREDVNVRVCKDTKRLVYPYLFSVFLLFIWNTIFGIKYNNYGMVERTVFTSLFGSGQYHSAPIWGDYPTIGMIWFLLAMFWCKFIYNLLGYLKSPYRYIAATLIAVTATLIDNYIITLPFGILTGASAVIFYMLGNACNEYKYFVSKHSKGLILIGLICWGLAITYSRLGMAACFYKIYPLDVIGACGGTWVIYKVAEFICIHTKKISAILTWFGINSMTILCAHFLEESSFLFEHLHIAPDWYVILPLRLIWVTTFTIIAFRISFFRNIYGIQPYNYTKDIERK